MFAAIYLLKLICAHTFLFYIWVHGHAGSSVMPAIILVGWSRKPTKTTIRLVITEFKLILYPWFLQTFVQPYLKRQITHNQNMVKFTIILMYAIDLQSPGVFASTPPLPISWSEGGMRAWQCGSSAGLTTQILQGTSEKSIKIRPSIFRGWQSENKKLTQFLFLCFSFSQPFFRVFLKILQSPGQNHI